MGFFDKLFGKSNPDAEPPETTTPDKPGQAVPPNNKAATILNQVIEDMTGIDGPFNMTDTVDSLGLDSLDVVEITMDLEEELDIEIPDEEVEQFRTYGDVLAYLSSRLGLSYTEAAMEEEGTVPSEKEDHLVEFEELSETGDDTVNTTYLVTDASDLSNASRIEAAMATIPYEGGSIEAYFRTMSEDLIAKHGPLVGVDYMSHFPKFEIYFAYEDGMRIYSGERTGDVDINFLTLGYVGEGPRYAQQFLSAAGFELTPEEIDSIEPGDSIELRDGKATIIKQSEKVVEEDMGNVKFLRERNEISFGTPAIYRHYSAPDKESAKHFLDKQNITAQSFFVVVETPDGIISKDRMGVFEQ